VVGIVSSHVTERQGVVSACVIDSSWPRVAHAQVCVCEWTIVVRFA